MGGQSLAEQMQSKINAAEQNRINSINNSQTVSQTLRNDQQGLGYGITGGGQNIYGINSPEYLTMRDPVTGELSSRFTETMGSANQALLDKAMTQGDTPWASLQRQQLQNQYGTDMGNLAQSSASQLAQARGNLAMRGGLGSGSRERLGSAGMYQQMLGQQGLGQNLANNNLNVSIQDEATKNNLLQSMGNVQQGIQQGNINRLGMDVSGQNLFNQQNYAEAMKAYGAQKTGEAQAKAAEGGK